MSHKENENLISTEFNAKYIMKQVILNHFSQNKVKSIRFMHTTSKSVWIFLVQSCDLSPPPLVIVTSWAWLEALPSSFATISEHILVLKMFPVWTQGMNPILMSNFIFKKWMNSLLKASPAYRAHDFNEVFKCLSDMLLCSYFLIEQVFTALYSTLLSVLWAPSVCPRCLSSLVNHGLLLQHTWIRISSLTVLSLTLYLKLQWNIQQILYWFNHIERCVRKFLFNFHVFICVSCRMIGWNGHIRYVILLLMSVQ